METTELKVDGMTCGACVASVTRTLQQLPGVQSVEVDLRSGTARITAAHASQQVRACVAALGETGYGAGPSPDVPAANEHQVGGCGKGGSAKVLLPLRPRNECLDRH
jgi:copper chaperone